MVFISCVKIEMPTKINPFLTLGILKDADPSQTKDKFREKMKEARNDDELRAKICFAYDVIVNKDYYDECEENTYKVKKSKKSVYYYCIIGDCLSLIHEIEHKPKLLYFKDPLKRSLLYIAARNGHTNICDYLINKGLNVNDIQSTGSTPLHGAAYYGQTNVVKLLIIYGAQINIKNEYGHLPKDEAMTKDIKDLLMESEKDPIEKLYQSLISKNIAKSLIPISSKGNIIAKKILCKLNNLPTKYKSQNIEKNWIQAWHGTNFGCLESIAEVGLKPPGGNSKNGNKIEVCVSHIEREFTVDNIHDWANGIFVSPSVFYSANPAYSKSITYNNEQWKVLVEVRVKPNSYYERESTCPQHAPKEGEPKMLEYRIKPENKRKVQVVSLTFVKKDFFDKAKNYQEGEFLSLF